MSMGQNVTIRGPRNNYVVAIGPASSVDGKTADFLTRHLYSREGVRREKPHSFALDPVVAVRDALVEARRLRSCGYSVVGLVISEQLDWLLARHPDNKFLALGTRLRDSFGYPCFDNKEPDSFVVCALDLPAPPTGARLVERVTGKIVPFLAEVQVAHVHTPDAT